MWGGTKLPVVPFDKKIIPQFIFLLLAQSFKMGFFLFVDDMTGYKIDEIYLWLVFAVQTLSIYFLVVAFSSELIRWMRVE